MGRLQYEFEFPLHHLPPFHFLFPSVAKFALTSPVSAFFHIFLALYTLACYVVSRRSLYFNYTTVLCAFYGMGICHLVLSACLQGHRRVSFPYQSRIIFLVKKKKRVLSRRPLLFSIFKWEI